MYWLKVLFTPSCWLQNNSYSAGWNMELKMLMNENKFEDLGSGVVRLGGVVIWANNHPYASFNTWTSLLHKHETGLEYDDDVRPSRVTILKAWDQLKDDCG